MMLVCGSDSARVVVFVFKLTISLPMRSNPLL